MKPTAVQQLLRLLASSAGVLAVVAVCRGEVSPKKMTFDTGMCAKSICDCFPKVKPQVMNCECNEAIQEVHLGALDLDERTLDSGQQPELVPPTVRIVSVAGCQLVSLLPQALISSVQLETLRVARVHTLTLSPQMFSSLRALEVDSVGDIPALPPHCFEGARDIKSFTFRNVAIGQIGPSAFSDVTHVNSVILDHVSIQEIAAHAINMQMSPESAFVLIGSQIRHADSKAITVATKNFTMEDCQFDVLNTDSINIVSDQFRLQNSSFRHGLFPYALRVNSTQTIITRNHFQYLHPMALKKLSGKAPDAGDDSTAHRGQLTFTENTVVEACKGSLDIDLSPYEKNANELSKYVAVERNQLPCECAPPLNQSCQDSFTLWLLREANTSRSPEKQLYYRRVIQKNQCYNRPCYISTAVLYQMIDKSFLCVDPHGISLTQRCWDKESAPSQDTEGNVISDSFQGSGGSSKGQQLSVTFLVLSALLVST